MTWIIKDDTDSNIIGEIYHQTDRGAVLIAAAYLDERLADALKARTIRNKKIEDRIYKGFGPLATFSAKINLGLLLGIYGPDVHRLLRTVKDIRNTFAHRSEPLNFESQKLRDLCSSIDIRGDAKFIVTTTAGEKQEIELDFDSDGKPKSALS